MKVYFLNRETVTIDCLSKLDEFIKKNCINQQSYKMYNIYNTIDKFNYNYILCENNDQIIGVMPFVLYFGEYGKVIHSMPFIGYGGIASVENNKYEVFKAIIKFLDVFSKKNNIDIITICTPPFRNNEYSMYKEIFNPNFEKRNFYQYLDLKEDIFANMKSKFRGNLRRNLKKCEKYGVTLEENYSLEYLRYWYDNVYVKRLTHTNCAIYPFSVFETIIKYFDKNRFKMVYALLENKIIGGGLYLNQGISIDNFMRAVDTDYFYTQAGTYLDNFSIDYAIKSKARYYNWQSCDEIDSTIYKYKEEWGSRLDYHYYFTKIVGDIKKIKNTPLDIIKREYKGIYVLPYDVL